METAKQCPWCDEEFTPTHQNEVYCSVQCNNTAKADRQKRKRDPIKSFIPIMMNNHEQISVMFNQGITEASVDQLEAYGIDISLCRHLKPSPIYDGKILLDFGEYLLITDTNFQTFKFISMTPLQPFKPNDFAKFFTPKLTPTVVQPGIEISPAPSSSENNKMLYVGFGIQIMKGLTELKKSNGPIMPAPIATISKANKQNENGNNQQPNDQDVA